MGGEKDLKKLLSENRDYVRVLENDKVQCLLSKHEMSNKFDAVSQYLSGKKFLRFKQKESEKKELKTYEPHIVPSKYISDKLFCRVTGRYVSKTEAAVVRHGCGQRFTTGVEYVASKKSSLLEEKTPEKRAEEKATMLALNPHQVPARMLESDEEEEGEEDKTNDAADGGEVKGGLDADETAADFWVPEWSEEAQVLRKKLGVDSPVDSDEDEDSEGESEEEEGEGEEDEGDEGAEDGEGEGREEEQNEVTAVESKQSDKKRKHTESVAADKKKPQNKAAVADAKHRGNNKADKGKMKMQPKGAVEAGKPDSQVPAAKQAGNKANKRQR